MAPSSTSPLFRANQTVFYDTWDEACLRTTASTGSAEGDAACLPGWSPTRSGAAGAAFGEDSGSDAAGAGIRLGTLRRGMSLTRGVCHWTRMLHGKRVSLCGEAAPHAHFVEYSALGASCGLDVVHTTTLVNGKETVVRMASYWFNTGSRPRPPSTDSKRDL